MRVKTGLEVLLDQPPAWLAQSRLGLLGNQATVGPVYQPASDLIAERFPGQLTALFGPQHGFGGEKQDNMVASADFIEPRQGLPVFSLYGERLAPAPGMLELIDVLLIDLPDVGTRVYTFATTMVYAMQAAAQQGKQVIILDRPNPIGGHQVEGNLLKPEMASLVGPYPLPMRHGLTLGELAGYYNQTQQLGCDLTIIPTQGWSRAQYFDATGLPWVLPSPNLPSLDTALVYPGQVLLEGTNLSEGRGTTRPFELFGAPFIDPTEVSARLAGSPLPGVVLRAACFQPTFHKWAGAVCHGFQLHVTDRQSFKPYYTTLTLLAAIRELYPEQFAWRPPPYEYEYDRRPFDLLTGDPAIREGLEEGRAVSDLESSWQAELQEYLNLRQQYLLYPA
ncbi:MAG: DUF1343 domain-containing protein [Deltaproteobacteria bacterium]|nr:DUF1343 domain-containing protein [Deltaproteobacteria bacterium]MBW1952121.1 DUF1343 domain-containing protein [Deltaproteobacteria bacterium]MBW1986190.1 DUF1343 domain-containing protein [Deltaproteobacteria bacterium]MBW2134944.1 DUF1343 domain-containing protein [Deltaproteobacteria bacterium]